MLSPLGSAKKNRFVYSFGKITTKLGNREYELTFREDKMVISTEKQFSVNTWVRVYGALSSGVLRVVFIDKLNIDINLFEKAIDYIKEHI